MKPQRNSNTANSESTQRKPGRPRKTPTEPTPPKRRVGRPSLFTPTVGEAIARQVEKTGYIEIAAESIGVCRETVHNWLAAGKAGDPVYEDFYYRAMEARAKFITDRLEALGQNKKDLKSQAWLLERLERSFQLQHKSQVEVSGPGGAPIQTQTTVTLSPEAAAAFRAQILGVVPDDEGSK